MEKEYPESEEDIPEEQRVGTNPETLLEVLESSQKGMEPEVIKLDATVAGHAAPPLVHSSQAASATGHDLGTSSAAGQLSGAGHGLRGPPRIEAGLHVGVFSEILNSGAQDHISSLANQLAQAVRWTN